MLGNLLLTFGANFFKGKARKEKEKRDLAEKKLEEKRAMDNALTLFQTKLDIQTQAESEADRLAEEKVNDKKFKEIQNIFKEDATNMAEYYGIDTALEIGQTMQERSINSGQSVKDMYNINRIENVQPNMDTLKGIAEDNRGITVQTTDAFQTAAASNLSELKEITQMKLFPLLKSGVDINTDPTALNYKNQLEKMKEIENMTALPAEGLSISELNTVSNLLEDMGQSFFPNLNEGYRLEGGKRMWIGSDSPAVQDEYRQYRKIITDYSNKINDLVKANIDPSLAFNYIHKEMQDSFKRGDYNIIPPNNTDTTLQSVTEENKPEVSRLLDQLETENNTAQRNVIKNQLIRLGYNAAYLENI